MRCVAGFLRRTDRCCFVTTPRDGAPVGPAQFYFVFPFIFARAVCYTSQATCSCAPSACAAVPSTCELAPTGIRYPFYLAGQPELFLATRVWLDGSWLMGMPSAGALSFSFPPNPPITKLFLSRPHTCKYLSN